MTTMKMTPEKRASTQAAIDRLQEMCDDLYDELLEAEREGEGRYADALWHIRFDALATIATVKEAMKKAMKKEAMNQACDSRSPADDQERSH